MSVAIIMTGGTIAKTYNPKTAVLENTVPVVEDIVAGLRLDDLEIEFVDLLHLDSLEITAEHRNVLVSTISGLVNSKDAIIVTHGTDTLALSANYVADHLTAPGIPIIFTGAMVPYVVSGNDAVQNITESLLALRILPSGYFVVSHNRILELPDVVKNLDLLTFESDAPDRELEV